MGKGHLWTLRMIRCRMMMLRMMRWRRMMLRMMMLRRMRIRFLADVEVKGEEDDDAENGDIE